MTEIYIAFVDTPGIFASIIRRVIKQKYIHVAIGLDENLDEAYSIGRRHPSIPLIAGFEKEEKRKILRAFPGADYMICSIPCTQEQKQFIKEELHEAMKNRYRYHYTILGLPFLLFGKPFYQKNHYTCSSYAAELLEKAGVCTWNKHFSLVTPKDFYEYKGKQKIFEGSLRELTEREKKTYPEYGTLTFPPISRPAYLSAAGNYIEELHEAMKNRYRYHYTILGLPFLLFGKPFYQKNHYTCSSYAAELLEKAGVCTWNKHFSLVTPKDFYEYKGKQKIFEGSLRELTEREKKTYPEYGTLTFPPISRPAYLSAAGNYITMAHVHNVREEERKGRRRRYER